MTKVEELKKEIKEVERRYDNATTGRARYMNWRRLVKLKKELDTYNGLRRKDGKV